MTYHYRINPFSGKLELVSAGGASAGSWGSLSTKIISSGVVSLDGPGRYALDTEDAAASDTLHTVSGLSDGDEVLLSLQNAARTVVVVDNVGNLKLQANFTLNAVEDVLRLVCDASNYLRESGGRSSND